MDVGHQKDKLGLEVWHFQPQSSAPEKEGLVEMELTIARAYVEAA